MKKTSKAKPLKTQKIRRMEAEATLAAANGLTHTAAGIRREIRQLMAKKKAANESR